MKKFWTLLKLDFKALLMNSNMGGRRNKRRAATGLGALILICAVMLYISGIYSFMFAQVLSPVGGLDIMLMLMAELGFYAVCVFGVIDVWANFRRLERRHGGPRTAEAHGESE